MSGKAERRLFFGDIRFGKTLLNKLEHIHHNGILLAIGSVGQVDNPAAGIPLKGDGADLIIVQMLRLGQNGDAESFGNKTGNGVFIKGGMVNGLDNIMRL